MAIFADGNYLRPSPRVIQLQLNSFSGYVCKTRTRDASVVALRVLFILPSFGSVESGYIEHERMFDASLGERADENKSKEFCD